MALTKKQKRELAEMEFDLEAKFGVEKFKGQRVFALVGISCAALTCTVTGIQLYNYVSNTSIPGFNYANVIKNADNAATSLAPIVWPVAALMASLVLVCAELGFYGLLHNFSLLMHPIGKGLYCLFLSSFFVNDNKGSYLYIINIAVAALGLAYLFMGTFCERKKLSQVQNAVMTE